MGFERTEIPEVILVEPDVHRDERGFLLETYHAARYAENGISEPFVQDNHSHSKGGILRGLHLQLRHPQGKLVRAIQGEILDVTVDVRRGSPTFGHHVAIRLSAENFRQLYIPPGFAHGFAVLSESADVAYKCTGFYMPGDELAIAWNDPEIGVPWPLESPVVSERDRKAPRLAEVLELLPRYEGASG